MLGLEAMKNMKAKTLEHVELNDLSNDEVWINRLTMIDEEIERLEQQ